MLLVNAGVDTVSNSLLVAMVNIVDNRIIYERLKAELREAWPKLEERPRYEDLESLPYLVRYQIDRMPLYARSSYYYRKPVSKRACG